MELFSYIIMLFVTNTFFMIREITIVIQHAKDPNVTTLDEIDYVLSITGICGAIIIMIFVIVIFKPVYSNMREDIFLKIGGNRNLWGKCCILSVIFTIYLEVLKCFSLGKSFLKLDLINCLEFMITGLFIWFTIL